MATCRQLHHPTRRHLFAAAGTAVLAAKKGKEEDEPKAEAQPTGGKVSVRPGTNMQGVNPQLADVVQRAGEMLPRGYRTEIISGMRDPRVARPGSQHPHGRAIDVSIIDPSGRRVPNIGQGPGTPAYQVYETFAANTQAFAKQVYGQDVTWGGHFRQGVALDLMHMQAGGPHYYDFSPATKEAASQRVAAYLAGPGKGRSPVTGGTGNWGPGGEGPGGTPPMGGYGGGRPSDVFTFGTGKFAPVQSPPTRTQQWYDESGMMRYRRISGSSTAVPKAVQSYINALDPKYRDMALRQYQRIQQQQQVSALPRDVFTFGNAKGPSAQPARPSDQFTFGTGRPPGVNTPTPRPASSELPRDVFTFGNRKPPGG